MSDADRIATLEQRVDQLGTDLRLMYGLLIRFLGKEKLPKPHVSKPAETDSAIDHAEIAAVREQMEWQKERGVSVTFRCEQF
jgi:hypothetical protein